MKLSIAFLVLLSIAGSALANSASELSTVESELADCVSKSDGTDPSNRACTTDAQKKIDNILNNRYKNKLNQLSLPAKGDEADFAEIKKRFIASERAWIKFRDAQCSMESADNLGGTLEVDEYLNCTYTKTLERVKTIDKLF